jgi:hypothetical protein
MNKTVKNVLVLFAGAAVLYVVMRMKSKEEPVKKEKKESKEQVEEQPNEQLKEPIVCPEGHLICQSNHNKCFDPTIKYIQDPCK